MIGDVVVRICWRGDRTRLEREALLLANLPDDVPHVDVLDSGESHDLTWMVTRRVDGDVLHDVWTRLTEAEHRLAITEIASILAALHGWRVPDHVRAVLSNHECSIRDDPYDYVEAFLSPLPVDRLPALVERARSLSRISADLAGEVLTCLRALKPFDPFASQDASTVVHGDVHRRNLLWRDGHVTALLDFEWARLGPSDLELECLVRNPDRDTPDVIAWLRVDYPQLFAHPHVVERVRLYELAYLIRQLLVWDDEEDRASLRRAAASPDRIASLVS